MQNLTNEKLMATFDELQDMKSTGVLEGDITRSFMGIYKDCYPTSDVSVSIIEKEVYYEMAMRFYARTNNIIDQLEAIRKDDKIRFADQVVNRAIRIVKEIK